MSEHLLETLFVMTSVDGKIDPAEQLVIDALRATVPELKGQPAPQRVSRKELLERLSTVDSLASRRQLYVCALEVAFANGHLNDSERQYLQRMQAVLRLDDQFIQHAHEVIGAKYRS